jgi:putative intracellular protease/amidase
MGLRAKPWKPWGCGSSGKAAASPLTIAQLAGDTAVIDVVVFDGFEALDALGPYEVLAYGGLDVRLAAREGPRSVMAGQGIEVRAHAPRREAGWLVVPGGAWEARARNPDDEAPPGAVGALARAHRGRGGLLASVCTGTMWLADAGLIGGRPATTHHMFWDELAATGADVRRGERVVDDGDLVTSGGVASGLFLGLHLVERLVGAGARRRVEREIELPEIPR